MFITIISVVFYSHRNPQDIQNWESIKDQNRMKSNVFIRQEDGSIIGKDLTCAFYIMVSFIPQMSLQQFYENIAYAIKIYPQSGYTFSRGDHIFSSSPYWSMSMSPYAWQINWLPYQGEYVSNAGKFLFPIQCVFGLPFSPTVHTDYFAANAWHAVRRTEIRHDTWDRRKDIPGRKASKTTQKINSNQTLLWSWNRMLWVSGETIVCYTLFFFCLQK